MVTRTSERENKIPDDADDDAIENVCNITKAMK